jgi:hypothetical protein
LQSGEEKARVDCEDAKREDEKKQRLEALETFDHFVTQVNVVSDEEEPPRGSGEDDKVPKEPECDGTKPEGPPKARRVRRTAAQIAEAQVQQQTALAAAREALDKFVTERGLTVPTPKGHGKGGQEEHAEEARTPAEGSGTGNGAEAIARAAAGTANDAAGNGKGKEGAAGGKGNKTSAKATAPAKSATKSAEPGRESIGSKQPTAEGKPKAAAKAKVKAAIEKVEGDEGGEQATNGAPTRASRGSADILEKTPIGEGSGYLFVQQMRCLIEFA